MKTPPSASQPPRLGGATGIRQPIVRPVSQVELRLDRADGAPFEEVRNLALRWIEKRAGRPLPSHAWDGRDFELEDVGAQRTAAVALENPRYWTARLDDADRDVPQRSWVTEIAIAEAEDELVLGTQLHCVTRGEDPWFLPSVPSFIKDVARTWPNTPRLERRAVSLQPWIVQSESDADDLTRLLIDPRRRLDVIVCALPENSELIDEAILNVSHLHRLTLGGAHVAVVTGPASFFLTDLVGREFSVFRSAVRVYLPGFDPIEDEPYRHPLALPGRIESWPEGGIEAFGTMLVANALRRSVAANDERRRLPAFHEVRRLASERRRTLAREAATPDTDLLRLAEDEIGNLKVEMAQQRELDEGLVKTAEIERDQAVEARRAAESAMHGLRARIQYLEARPPMAAAEPATVPDTLDHFEQWVADNLAGAVEVHNRALRGVKKSDYEDPSLIYKALLLLRDHYVPMRREGGLGRKNDLDAALAELGLERTPTFSGNRAGEEGETYFVRHGTGRKLLDEHLKKGNSRESRHCFRCYFFWDDATQIAVVGWLPSHLDNRFT